MNPHDMSMDNWLNQIWKSCCFTIQIMNYDWKVCKNALHNYCLMMSGKWDNKEFVSKETHDSFRQFMGYGSDRIVLILIIYSMGLSKAFTRSNVFFMKVISERWIF